MEPTRKPHATWSFATLADLLVQGFAWLQSECIPPRREPKPPLLQLEGGTAEFEKLYRIGDMIGQGGFGKVFACQELGCRANDDAPLCVKVVPFQGRRVSREAKVCEKDNCEILLRCLRMDHPNIAKYHRFLHTEDAMYTVMDRCCGPDLVDYVKDQGEQLPTERIRGLSLQILHAVAAVHRIGIMHRDIKPENFRFKDSAAEVLQLLDFGFAKLAPSAPAANSVTGTLLYAAPEVFDGVYGAKVDVWSAGVVLFQMFAGHPPFQTSDVGILRSLHRDPLLTGTSLFRGPVRRQTPDIAQDLICLLLSVDPSERLDAEVACGHAWFDLDTDGEEVQSRRSMRRVSSQRSAAGETASVELKRSNFVWDLASAATTDDEEALVELSGGASGLR